MLQICYAAQEPLEFYAQFRHLLNQEWSKEYKLGLIKKKRNREPNQKSSL